MKIAFPLGNKDIEYQSDLFKEQNTTSSLLVFLHFLKNMKQYLLWIWLLVAISTGTWYVATQRSMLWRISVVSLLIGYILIRHQWHHEQHLVIDLIDRYGLFVVILYTLRLVAGFLTIGWSGWSILVALILIVIAISYNQYINTYQWIPIGHRSMDSTDVTTIISVYVAYVYVLQHQYTLESHQLYLMAALIWGGCFVVAWILLARKQGSIIHQMMSWVRSTALLISLLWRWRHHYQSTVVQTVSTICTPSQHHAIYIDSPNITSYYQRICDTISQ